MLQPATVLDSPSFNGYSSSRLAEIAARVIDEQQDDDHVLTSNTNVADTEQKQTQETVQEKGKDLNVPVTDSAQQDLQEDGDDVSFEFSVARVHEHSSVSADEIFQSGHIRPIFPLFNTDLINTVTNWTTPHAGTTDQAPAAEARVSDPTSAPTIRLTLKKLLMQEVEREADNELETLPPETYCIWTPKNGDRHETEKKKRKSGGGSSKRWKIPEIFGWPGGGDGGEENQATREVVAGDGERATKAGSDRRRSYSPDRRDIVGFFHHVNGLTRVIHPF